MKTECVKKCWEAFHEDEDGESEHTEEEEDDVRRDDGHGPNFGDSGASNEH